ncbi:MAG: hypothetical protein HND56_09280 [Pseudomonadota bacterium]|jgi:hypothetical protein|nr:hypothetical protein [Pseudomonadota bacterium]QKK05867.1 MAG: hypothetical protein HND56_09280 [Pseudomonadota bacterium]
MSSSRFTPPEDGEKKIIEIPFVECQVKAEDLNIAIAETEDGRTCIYCDYPLEHLPSVVVLDNNTAAIHLIGGDFGTEGFRLQYPLDYDKINIWKREGMTYFAVVSKDGISDIYEIDVIFVDM